eukprot:gene14507-16016_t
MCRETVKIPTGKNDGITQNRKPSRRKIFSSQVLGKRKLQVTSDEGAVKKKFIKKDVRSVLKRTGTDDLLSFTFEKAGEEMHERCPVLFNILKVASKASHKSDDHNVNTAVVIAASVCLNNRSQQMIAVQLLISLTINESSYTSTLVRLKSMRLAVSRTYFNKKLDQLRVMHDADVTRLMEIEKRKLQAAFPVPERTAIAETVTDGNSSLSEHPKPSMLSCVSLINPFLQLSESSPVVKKHSEKATNIRINSKASYLDASETDSKGFKLCFDNVDTRVEVHDMTEENQNIDLHKCVIDFVPNRIDNETLSMVSPQRSLQEFDNANFLFSQDDYMLQSKNYIVVVERIITEDIKCLHFLKDAVTKHIIHKHSRDTATKCKMGFLGVLNSNENDHDGIHEILENLQKYQGFLEVLNSNENDHDGIHEILENLQKYQVFVGEEEDRIYNEQGVVGDQLSVERGGNAKFNFANGFTPQERFDNMHFEIADFHAEMKFLQNYFLLKTIAKLLLFNQVFMDNFYKTGCKDCCMLGSDKVFVKRRNVVTDVKRRYAACKKFLDLGLESRVLAATMTILNIGTLDEDPDESALPSSLRVASKDSKKGFLNKLASDVVNYFILKTEALVQMTQAKIETEQELTQLMKTADGKFMCQEPSCLRTFQFNGKRKKDHEKAAHEHVKSISEMEKKERNEIGRDLNAILSKRAAKRNSNREIFTKSVFPGGDSEEQNIARVSSIFRKLPQRSRRPKSSSLEEVNLKHTSSTKNPHFQDDHVDMESEQMIFEEDDQTDLISNESWEPVPGGSGSEGQNVDTPEKDVCNTESTVGVFEIADLPIYMYELSQSKGVSPCKEDLTIFCVNDFDSKNKRIKKNSFVFVYRRPLKFANDDVNWVYGCTCNRNELMSLKSYAQELDLTFADFKDIRGTCIHAKAVDEFLANFCSENNIPLHQYNTAEFTDDQLKESIPVPVYPVSSSDSSVAVWSESNQMGLVTSRYNELYCLTCPQPRRCSHCKILQEHFASETEGLPKEATDLQD